MKECICFLDYILVPSRTFAGQLVYLAHTFQKLRKHNLKLNPAKCRFFQPRVTYCGHGVSNQGVETDPSKVEKIKDCPVPTSVNEVRSFLGFAGYYRKFVEKFSHIAKPLTDMLVGCKGKGKATRSPNWTWGPGQQHSFEMLRDKLTSPSILAYPNYKDQFILHTDACSIGLGAVLCQNQEGKTKVIAYASRGLNKSEKNYPAHKLEFLALKWDITDKFNDYLYGQTFEVLTDNNPLTYDYS